MVRDAMGKDGNNRAHVDPSLIPWALDSELGDLSEAVARYSTGFLRARPEVWFKSFVSHWSPLAHSLGVELRFRGISASFDFPEDLVRVTPIEIDGEIAVVGIAQATQDAIITAVCPGVGELQQDVVMEYIERRLVSTLAKSWTGTVASLQAHYIASDKVEEAEVIGVFHLAWYLDNKPCSVWIGLGPRVLDRVDALWRDSIAAANVGSAQSNLQQHTLSVELAELAVPPAMLIDYMRSGTLINLGLPISDQVTLRLDGKEWATGRMRQFDGKFSIEIDDFEPGAATLPDATTRVQVELFRLGVNGSFISEHSQAGAVVLTDLPLTNHVSLVIGGESVASAIVVVVENELALSVLPK